MLTQLPEEPIEVPVIIGEQEYTLLLEEVENPSSNARRWKGK